MKKNEASPCWTLRLQHTSLPKSLSRCRVGWVLHRTTMTSSDQRALAQPRTLPSLLEHYPKVVGGTVCNLKACPLQKFYNPVIFFKMFWVVFVRHDWLPHCHKNQNTLISKTEKKKYVEYNLNLSSLSEKFLLHRCMWLFHECHLVGRPKPSKSGSTPAHAWLPCQHSLQPSEAIGLLAHQQINRYGKVMSYIHRGVLLSHKEGVM